MRRKKIKRIEKNKAPAKRLEEWGLWPVPAGMKIEVAKQDGRWHAPNPIAATEELFACLPALLEG